MKIESVNRLGKGGSLKRSLGMASGALTIPKAFGFEAATHLQFDSSQFHA
jgi:hypothetical protein